ncbi:MAG: DUF2911 domain-containing protein [Bacteroidota bacterium]
MKKTVIIVGSLALILVVAFIFLKRQIKSASPEDGVDFNEGDLKIHVFYNRPLKKGRVIYAADGLVPFGKVWRTGANEPTTIETNKTLLIKGQELKPGKYSIWTIPDAESWKVIFNSDVPAWGINFNGESNREPAADVVTVEVPVGHTETEIEQFTISLEKTGDEMELIFLWDKTVVAVPFIAAGQ